MPADRTRAHALHGALLPPAIDCSFAGEVRLWADKRDYVLTKEFSSQIAKTGGTSSAQPYIYQTIILWPSCGQVDDNGLVGAEDS